MGNNRLHELMYVNVCNERDACSQEYSGIIFSILKKTLVKRKKLVKIVLTNKGNSEHIYLKMFQKKVKILRRSKPKILSVGQP